MTERECAACKYTRERIDAAVRTERERCAVIAAYEGCDGEYCYRERPSGPRKHDNSCPVEIAKKIREAP